MKHGWKKLLYWLGTLSIAAVYLTPTWMVLVNSLKVKKEANHFGMWFSSVLHFENYSEVFTSANIPRALMNGVFISTGSVLMILITASMAAFVIARSDNRKVKGMYYIFLTGLVIPVAFIPTYLVLNQLNLLNTYQGLILISATYGLPMSIFLYVGSMKSIPRELDEAAVIDGCPPLKMFLEIILPLLMPTTVTLLIFNFVGCWNDVQVPLFFASSDKWALPMTMYNFYGAHASYWNLIFADIIITIVPLVILYVFAQRYIIEGMTAGAVKG